MRCNFYRRVKAGGGGGGRKRKNLKTRNRAAEKRPYCSDDSEAPPAFGLKGNAARPLRSKTEGVSFRATQVYTPELACYSLKFPIFISLFYLSSIGR